MSWPAPCLLLLLFMLGRDIIKAVFTWCLDDCQNIGLSPEHMHHDRNIDKSWPEYFLVITGTMSIFKNQVLHTKCTVLISKKAYVIKKVNIWISSMCFYIQISLTDWYTQFVYFILGFVFVLIFLLRSRRFSPVYITDMKFFLLW